MFTAALAVLLASTSYASPYFRPIDPAHVHQVLGGFIDPNSPGNSSAGTAYALATHSVKDGCLMPSIVCEDWSPAMLGFSVNAGRVQVSIGPAVNLTPLAKLGLLKVLEAATAQDALAGVKGLLGSQPIGGPDVSMSFGPALAIAPVQGGVVLPVNRWQGQFRIFAGAALSF